NGGGQVAAQLRDAIQRRVDERALKAEKVEQVVTLLGVPVVVARGVEDGLRVWRGGSEVDAEALVDAVEELRRADRISAEPVDGKAAQQRSSQRGGLVKPEEPRRDNHAAAAVR